jgi:non-ribosomal peptide synthetase component F
LIEDIYTLSPLQQGMLFHALHSAESGAYVVQTCIRFAAGLGAAERAALAQSWQQVVDRHPVLRTAFEWLELDEPVQVVYAPFPLTWEHHDWRGLPAAEQAERLAEHLRIDRRRGFDLSTPPLLRLALIQLGAPGAETCQLVWTHHHAILDGWSLPILLRELFSCYAAARQGRPAILPPARPYRDFIAWLNRQSLADAETFWRTELAAFSAPAPLPGAGAGAENGEARRPAVQQTLLGAAASDALGAFARRHQLTPNTLAQGAWALLLARAGGQDDVVFGTVTAGRGAPLEGIETMVGLLINTLPVRVRVPQGTPAVPWLRRLQEAQVAARQFEHTPLPKVRAWSEVPVGAALFDSILAFENYPLDEALRQDAATTVAIAGVDGREQTHYPLTLNVQPGSRWLLRLAATEPRFDAVYLARLLGSLEALLLGLIREDLAAVPVAELPALAAAERQQLLIELPAEPGGARAAPPSLAVLFARRAARSPWQIAAVGRGVPLTYAELDQRSASLAGFLRRSGVGPEVRVGLAVEPSLARVVGLLGILRAGGAAVPIDPASAGAEESRRVLAEAQVALVLTMERWLAGFEPTTTILCLDRDWPRIAAERAPAVRPLDRSEEPESLAVISATSGLPGLMFSRRAIAGPELPDGLDAATAEVFAALRSGSRLVIADNAPDTAPPRGPRLHALVLDRRQQPVPGGSSGELVLAGPGLARGILHRPDLTAERFVPHPWSGEPGERLYRTTVRARQRADGGLLVGEEKAAHG